MSAGVGQRENKEVVYFLTTGDEDARLLQQSCQLRPLQPNAEAHLHVSDFSYVRYNPMRRRTSRSATSVTSVTSQCGGAPPGQRPQLRR